MGRDTGRLREEVKRCLHAAGAAAVGFAQAAAVPEYITDRYNDWLSQGRHAGMDYMTAHNDVRSDPRLLLVGARTVISMAFPYSIRQQRDSALPAVARYALLPDYHDWIRRAIRKSGITELIGEEHKDWRICVDSAPMFERWWAMQAGIAVRGRNGMAIVPGIGAEVLLAEIITTIPIEPDTPAYGDCGSCLACIKACPTGALQDDGNIDCHRCLSYLTIEHRGAWTDSRHLDAMATPAGRNTFFGCDRCVTVCPHNNSSTHAPVTCIEEMLSFAGTSAPARSCLKRAKSEGLARNLDNCSKHVD